MSRDPEATAVAPRSSQPATSCTIRWGAWFGDRDLALQFPPGWNVKTYGPRDGENLSDADIRRSFDQPIGSPRIPELASGRHSPCIVVDDLSRPTPAARLMPYILEELQQAGITPSDVLVLGGVGNLVR
jgi:lactate racemase